MYYYQVSSLIDITQHETVDNLFERNQQRNFETLLQTLNLRSQIIDYKNPQSAIEDIDNDYQFGINHIGNHSVWTFKFMVEYEGIYSKYNDKYGTVKNDLTLAPIILGLSETIKQSVPLFYASGPEKNIYFVEIKSEDY